MFVLAFSKVAHNLATEVAEEFETWVILRARQSGSLSPVLRGEGWGEGRFCGLRNFPKRPSPYPLP